MENKDNIDELISKFLSGEASPDEAMLLEDWKNENFNNSEYYKQCVRLFSNESTNQIKAIDTQKAWNTIKQTIDADQKIKPLFNNTLLKIAASFILLIGLGLVINYIIKKDKQEISYSTQNETLTISLSDESVITLSPESNVILDKNFGETNRTLHLKGDAYFSVVHQEEVPFIVDAGGVFIKDIGTKFSIKSSADTDTVYVHVDEGIVLLFDSLGSSIEIKATENALYIKSTKTIIDSKTLEIKSSQLTFSNTSLADIVIKLNELYHTSIVIENSTLKMCSITAQFNGENLETIMGVIVETLGLKYEKTATGYLIKGQSCQPQ